MVFRSFAARLVTCSVVVGLSLVASAAQPIRSVAVSVNKTAGIVTSFDLTFGTAPAATALYACWDADDRGESTNGWAHVEKIGDIAGDVTAFNVPISRFPSWGGADCRALRFVMEPGALFDRAGTFLMTENNGGQYIDTGFMLDKTDKIDLSWTFTHITAQPDTIICGSVAYDTSKNNQDYFIVRYAGGGKVECGLSKRSGSAAQKTAVGVSWTTTAADKYIRDNVRVHVAISATEQSIWTNSVVTSTGAVVGGEVLLAQNNQEFDAAFSQQTNCFLFAWPGYDAGGGLAWWPSNKQTNKLMAKMYHCDITRSGEPAVSLLPVMKDGVACFYDTVRKAFLHNIGTGAFSLSAASPDVGVASEAILYDGPCATAAVGCPADAATAVVAGRVESAGSQASSVSILFAYAPVGTELPELSVLKEGLVSGSDYSAEVAGLTPGTCYAYAVDFVNDRGVRLPQPLTGTFYAGLVNAWTGPASGGDWANDDNWSRGRKPAEHDLVTISAEVSVDVGEATAHLSQLTVAGTLTATSWATKIAAGDIVVAAGGIITCADGGETAESISRVWIDCQNLMVAAGGAIDVQGKGYAPAPCPSANQVTGLGPGGEFKGGAAHGGYGSKVRIYSDYVRAMPYGSAEDPDTPGSSGCSANDGVGGAGGGVIRVVATGTVCIDGHLTADGGVSVGAVYAGGGSGGSICLTCRCVKGSGGVISAAGRVCAGRDLPTAHNSIFAGGGGRIALHYDPAVQTAEMVEELTITAAPGIYDKARVNAQDVYHSEAEMGTLWFADATFLKFLGTGLWGQLVNVAADPLTLEQIDMRWGQVRFADAGAQVSVTGDVTVRGDSQLEIGGDTTGTRHYNNPTPVATRPVALTVGGDLVIRDGGRLDVRGGQTNGVDGADGALVKVDGTLRIGTGSVLYSITDGQNGASPRFEVGSLDVQEGGVFSAAARGFSSGMSSHVCGYGPGGGNNPGWYDQGGGHGGHGGLEGRADDASHDYGSHTNDCPYLPVLAGSGAGYDGWNKSGDGGGVISVTASKHIQVDGTVTVDGETQYNGGAGGTIYLQAQTFAGSGVLTAKGGDSGTVTEKSGAGGGGRIAVWTGEKWDGWHFNSSRLVKTNEPQDRPECAFTGTWWVDGGANDSTVTAGKPVSCAGGDGSVWFVHVGPKPGLIMIVR